MLGAGIPHHLIDVLDPHEDFSAGHFHDLAHEAVNDILSRGRLPIVVGGTGFYLRMFMFGKPQGGSATKAEEEQVEALLAAARQAAASAAGVPEAELNEDQLWQAGISVLSHLGDDEAAERCCAALRLTKRSTQLHQTQTKQRSSDTSTCSRAIRWRVYLLTSTLVGAFHRPV